MVIEVFSKAKLFLTQRSIMRSFCATLHNLHANRAGNPWKYEDMVGDDKVHDVMNAKKGVTKKWETPGKQEHRGIYIHANRVVKKEDKQGVNLCHKLATSCRWSRTKQEVYPLHNVLSSEMHLAFSLHRSNYTVLPRVCLPRHQ